MDIKHHDWHAEFSRRLRHFHVKGNIIVPDEKLSDGAYLVPAKVLLEKSDLHNTDPTILALDLIVLRERKFPYDPPPQPPAQEARCYVPDAGPVEEAYAYVHIFYEGVCIQECRVIRLA